MKYLVWTEHNSPGWFEAHSDEDAADQWLAQREKGGASIYTSTTIYVLAADEPTQFVFGLRRDD